MQKKALFRDIDIKVLNLSNTLEEVRRKGLTGYLRTTYWEAEEFLLFVNGVPKRAITITSEGKRLLHTPETFRLKDKEGTASLVETTLDDLVAFQEYRHFLEEDGPIVFFPFGTMTQEPVSLNFLDINKELMLAERSHLDGYVALYTESSLIGAIIFAGGKPVSVIDTDGRRGKYAVETISRRINPPRTYMSMYAVDPELLVFLYSLGSENINKIEASPSELKEAREVITRAKLSAVVLTESEGIYRYDLFFRGQFVNKFVKDKALFVTEDSEVERLAEKVENLPEKTIHIYEIRIVERPQPLEVNISPPEEEEEILPGEVVAQIRSDFVRMVGPVGKLIWDKQIKEMDLKESALSKNQLKQIIDKLMKEIPEEDMKEEFRESIRRVRSDIL